MSEGELHGRMFACLKSRLEPGRNGGRVLKIVLIILQNVCN